MARIIIHIEVISKDNSAVEILNISLLRKNTIENVENRIILAYSLKKINTNPIDAYSMLNPDTSSDSPSAKSKGVRFVSASSNTTQITAVKGTTETPHRKLPI